MTASSSRYRFWLIVMGFVVWGSVFLDRMTVLYLGPFLVKDLHLNTADIGYLSAILSITFAFTALIFGSLSDHIRARKPVLIPAVFLFSLMSWLSGVAGSFIMLLVIRGMMGTFEGPVSSLLPAAVAAESPKEHRGRNTGILMSATALVGLTAAPIMATQVATHFGWRWAFFLAGIPGMIVGILLWRFMKEPPLGFQTVLRGQATTPTIQKYPWYAALRYRNVWLACLSTVGFMMWLWVLSTFGPLYLTEEAHLSGTAMGWVMSAGGAGAFLFSVFVPWVSDRMGRKRAVFLFGLLTAFNPLCILFIGLTHLVRLGAAFLFLTWAGDGLAPLLMVFVTGESVPAGLAATAVALPTMLGELLGGTVIPAVTGAVALHAGLAVTMWVACAGALLMAFPVLATRETAPRVAGEDGGAGATAG